MPSSDAVREVGDDPVHAQVAHALDVLRFIHGVDEDLSSEVVIRLQQHGCDRRKVESDMGGIQRDDIGYRVRRQPAVL